MKRITTISLLIAAAFGSSAAQAEVVSNAWLGPISIQLIDLDLNDGIAPSITPTSQYAQVYGSAYDSAAANNPSYSQDTSSYTPPLSGSTSTAISQVSSSLTGSDPTSANQYASGSAVGPTGSPGNYGEYYGYSYAYGFFTLSANTQVIFSADASTSASSDAPYNTGQEWAWAEAYLYGYLYNYTFVGQDYINSIGYNYQDTYNEETGEYEYSNVNDSDARTLSFSLSNPFAEAVSGYLYGRAYAQGYSYSDYKSPSQVPVPAALPLLASALGLFGFSRRKV